MDNYLILCIYVNYRKSPDSDAIDAKKEDCELNQSLFGANEG